MTRRGVAAGLLAGLALVGPNVAVERAAGQETQAAVEARVPWPPQAVRGSDGRTQLAYELHVFNFYRSAEPLSLKRVTVFADRAPTPLASFAGADLARRMSPAAGDGTAREAPPIEGGRRAVVFVWLDPPPGAPAPHALRHVLEFTTPKGVVQRVEGVRIPVVATPPVALGPPLRGGRWLAYDGPGGFGSHHWGSLVAANGALTIPQRYAIDFYALDATGHTVRAVQGGYAHSAAADWAGYGAEVLAVADGVVRDARDGVADNTPFVATPEPSDLTARTLYGNFVVLQVAPGVFVHYAHLKRGSVAVRVGERVRRGGVVGRLGVSGAAPAPHLHLQVSNAATFEESEGLPFTFDAFESFAPVSLGEAFDPDERHPAGASLRHAREMPLDGAVLAFGPLQRQPRISDNLH